MSLFNSRRKNLRKPSARYSPLTAAISMHPIIAWPSWRIGARSQMMLGRMGGVHLLEKAFAADDYSREDLQYVANILKHSSRKTLWRTFDSCNNYKISKPVPKIDTQIHYWYADGEEKERKLDIAYMKQHFPQTEFKVLPKLGHAGLVLLKPELFVTMIDELA